MEWLKIIIQRIKTWFILQYMELYKKQLQKIYDNPPKITQEVIQGCEHRKLKKITALWYQCSQCKAIFYIFGSICYHNKKQLEDEIEIVRKGAK